LKAKAGFEFLFGNRNLLSPTNSEFEGASYRRCLRIRCENWMYYKKKIFGQKAIRAFGIRAIGFGKWSFGLRGIGLLEIGIL